jgi:signal transduction histidine kinase
VIPGNSLRLRLLLGASLALGLTLMIAGASLYLLFQRYVEQVASQQLQNHFLQLAANVSIDAQGKVKSGTPLSDPRFQKPYGGLYWQINEAATPPLRSRSLWDFTLAQSAVADGTVHIINGPQNSHLFALEKHIIVPNASSQGSNPIDVTIAIDRAEIDQTLDDFGWELAAGLALLFAALLASSLIQTHLGLSPLEALRRGVEGIMEGRAARLEGPYPSEVGPLAQELNALLSARESELERARLRAGNLAHGLKTPLTVMSAVADELADKGQANIAQEIRDGSEQMRSLVERELARARMASGEAVQLTLIAPIVTRMMNALKHTTDNEALLWHSSVPEDAAFPMEASDLLELVGNLLDNARKWAKSQIYVSFVNDTLAIDDDGPGVPEDQMQAIQKRGVRLDENVSGSGLGLGIVRDLCETYGLDLKMKRSSLGGLSVSISRKKIA